MFSTGRLFPKKPLAMPSPPKYAIQDGGGRGWHLSKVIGREVSSCRTSLVSIPLSLESSAVQ